MAPPVYRAAPAGHLRIVAMDVLTAIYHRPSGQTHLVASPVPEMLAAMGDAAIDAATLLERLVADFDLADPDATALSARLDELAQAGLVARA
ncbi:MULTISPECIES: HPr-rel-A system PqqD family peptide chaperone [unclassified Sphingomonas]|jgi:PqqD family protein of HPr-rel-A system|uniref:HPr-rel-A system PqqD family peptide chaperone n=1 Tax=unclassified Sphingomonas TaxID=196159 RepID=UPI00082CDC92|nr:MULTISPECIES: HPr-rel-A system PqqD family peptide chaperone [unclassified Sphingomonas]